MKKLFYYITAISFFCIVGCTANWEDYSPPPFDGFEEEPDPEAPVLIGDIVKVKILSIGTLHANSALSRFGHVADSLGVDFMVARELDKNNLRSGKDIDQSDVLAKAANMYHQYCKSQNYQEGEYGIAVYSRNENYDFYTEVIPTNRPIGIIRSKVRTEKGNLAEIAFAGVMLDDSKNGGANRISQGLKVLELTKSISQVPLILAGNVYIQTEMVALDPMTELLAEQFKPAVENCPFTLPSAGATPDFIFYKWVDDHVKVVDFKILDSPTSRLMCYAELEISI